MSNKSAKPTRGDAGRQCWTASLLAATAATATDHTAASSTAVILSASSHDNNSATRLSSRPPLACGSPAKRSGRGCQYLSAACGARSSRCGWARSTKKFRPALRSRHSRRHRPRRDGSMRGRRQHRPRLRPRCDCIQASLSQRGLWARRLYPTPRSGQPGLLPLPLFAEHSRGRQGRLGAQRP
jgi:hypothetical protein